MCDERATPGEMSWVELSAPHLARYFFAAEKARGRRILDAGSGSGYGTRILATAGASSVVGVDLDAGAVEAANCRFGGDSVSFLTDNCERLDQVTGPFDLICNFENLEHLQCPDAFLARARTLVAPQGLLIISTPDRNDTPPFVNGRPRNPHHVHEWYRDDFYDLLAQHFQSVEMRAQVRTAALQGRSDGVAALREGLTWTNPLGLWLWRKLRRGPRGVRAWKALEGLAAPTVADYPIVPEPLAPILGKTCFLVATCSQPRL